jgi:tRNA-splicing ligase RtcB
MGKAYRYAKRNVHDLDVAGMTVRLWSVEGAEGKSTINRLFEPLARTGFVHPYVALMPDWHPAQDAVVGSVVPTWDVLLPSVVGGDIGCGVATVRLPVTAGQLEESFEALARRLREVVPVGSSFNSVVTERVMGNALWNKKLRAGVPNRTWRKLMRQFGSLGGGNHFLEVQQDHDGYLWIMLHSGSRYLGVEVRDWYVNYGRDQSGVDRRLYSRVPFLTADSDAACDYLADMRLVVEFASESRHEMLLRAVEVVKEFHPEIDAAGSMRAKIDINHNYVEQEQHFGERLYVHRKGAIRVANGQNGSVPGSMGTSSFVIEGRGNEYAFNSCAHGGGRRMSRAEAARRVSRKDYDRSVEGTVCAHEGLLLDEAPAAYKDIRTVMRGQVDLVKILFELRPLVSVKGR